MRTQPLGMIKYFSLMSTVFVMLLTGSGCVTTQNGRSEAENFMNALAGNPALYHAASRAYAREGKLKKANGLQAVGDILMIMGGAQQNYNVNR